MKGDYCLRGIVAPTFFTAIVWPRVKGFLAIPVMGERERTQEYGNEIHCHVYTFAKFQENTTILSYYTCTIYHRYYEYTISEKHIVQ